MNEKVISLVTPDARHENVLLRYRSEYGMGGCQGIVVPATLRISGKDRLVQVKRFYKESYDDTGCHFSQDPDKEAKKSYEALAKLQRLGYKVVPYFGMYALQLFILSLP